MGLPVVGEFKFYSKELLHILIIALLAWLLMRMGRRLLHLFQDYMKTRAESAEETRRIETLIRVFRYSFTLLILLVAGMLVLTELGISIAPILGAAGVVGIAVGFAAQNLIKDYFSGFFLLVENQIRQGDVVEVGGKTGQVEDITLRYVSLRDYEGNVHYVPNGLITTVTNKSRGHAYAVIDLGIAYSASIDEAFKTMRTVAAELRSSPEFADKILEDIEIAGVQDLAESALNLRCRFKTIALEQWTVRREFLRRIKEAFDAQGIDIPYPHLEVSLYNGQGQPGTTQVPISAQRAL